MAIGGFGGHSVDTVGYNWLISAMNFSDSRLSILRLRQNRKGFRLANVYNLSRVRAFQNKGKGLRCVDDGNCVVSVFLRLRAFQPENAQQIRAFLDNVAGFS